VTFKIMGNGTIQLLVFHLTIFLVCGNTRVHIVTFLQAHPLCS